MVLDKGLLAEAKAERNRLIDLDYEADRARLSYQHAIRKLHAEGASLREIAEALDLSHQRVHQIVEGADGKVALKNNHDNRVACSFCGRQRAEARHIVAGPGVFICDRCIPLASEVVQGGETRADGNVRLSLATSPKAKCSFCGCKIGQRAHRFSRRRVQRIADGSNVSICSECVGLCYQIVKYESDLSTQRGLPDSTQHRD